MAPAPTGRYDTLSPAWLEHRERCLAELASQVERIRDRLASTGLSYDVDSIFSEFSGAGYDIGERALYADLVAVGPAIMGDADLKHQVVTGGLFQAGRPLLLCAPGKNVTLQPKTVVLAWDSRPQAAHALRDALEILIAAKAVHVTMIDPVTVRRSSGDEPGADVATYLARHGVNVTVDTLPSSGRTVTEVLQKHAMDIDAELIVMGAYGHSRVREFIFGGATRSMLDRTDVPVLMAR
jgi:nucleotide-binding universal stress UspA family protein